MATNNLRYFIKKSALGIDAMSLFGSPSEFFSRHSNTFNEDLSVHIFSKYLQFLDYKTTGEMAEGVYLLKVDSGNNFATKRIVIE
jgi:L-ribulose-5-phosphate 3-epimerase